MVSMLHFNSDEELTIFGEHVIERGVFLWRLKIIKIECNNDSVIPDPHIGIVTSDDEYLQKYTYSLNWEQGCQLDAGCHLLWSSLAGIPEKQRYNCLWNGHGDILEMVLDLNKRTLKYKVNGKDFGVAFNSIPTGQYRLALGCMDAKGSEFEILDSHYL